MIKKLFKMVFVLSLAISSLVTNVNTTKAADEIESTLVDVKTDIQDGYLYTTFVVTDPSRIESISADFINYGPGGTISVYSYRNEFEINNNEIMIKEFLSYQYFSEIPLTYELKEVTINFDDGTSEYHSEYEEFMLDKNFTLYKEDCANENVTVDDFYPVHADCDYMILYKGTDKYSSLGVYCGTYPQIIPFDIKILGVNPALVSDSKVNEYYNVSVEFTINAVDSLKTFVFKDVKALLLEEPKVMSNLTVDVKDEKLMMQFDSDCPIDIYEFNPIFKNEDGEEYWFSNADVTIDGNQVTYQEYLPVYLYEREDLSTYTLESLQINTNYSGNYEYTMEDEEIQNKSFTIDPNNNEYLNIKAEDIQTIFQEGENSFLTLYKNLDYHSQNIEFKYFNMNFTFETVMNNPAFDKNVNVGELMEVSVLISSYFNGLNRYFVINHVPAIVQENISNLKNVELVQNDNMVEIKLDHQYFDDIDNVLVEFVFADGTIQSKSFETNFYHNKYDDIPYKLLFDMNEYEYMADYGIEDYYLKSLTISCHNQTEIYTLDNTHLLDNIFIRFEKENPTISITEKDIVYKFTTLEKYLKIDRDTRECYFENIQFGTADDAYFFVPRIIYYDQTNENEIFEVSVIVRTTFGKDLKEFRIDHVPAKFIDREQDITGVRMTNNKNKLHLEFDYQGDQRIRSYTLAFVSENDPNNVIYMQMPNHFFGYKPLITIDDTIMSAYYPNEITTYKFMYIELNGEEYDVKIKGDDPMLADLSFTLDPKECDYYSDLDTNDEAIWYFKRMDDTIKIQNNTGKVDYSNLNILSSMTSTYVGEVNQLIYIKKFEIIDNPALKENVDVDKTYYVDVLVTYKTIGGFERTYQLRNVPARIIEPIGKIDGSKTKYHEYAVSYLEYLKNNLESHFNNKDPQSFTVNLFNGETKEITVEPMSLSEIFKSNNLITYYDKTTYYDVGLEYIFEGVDKDSIYFDEFMNDIYFVNKNVLYLVDENRNIVNRDGEVLMDYDSRPIREYKSNNNDVELSSKEGSIPTYTEINAEKNESFNDVFENYVAYDMSLYANGGNVQPADQVKVGINIPKYMEGSDLEVVYIDDDGNPTNEKFDVIEENGVAYFETTHFSTYALVAKEKIDVVVPDIDENSDLENLDIRVNNQKLVYGVDYEYSVEEKLSEKDENVTIVEVTIKFIGDYANLKDVVKSYEIVNQHEANVVISPIEKESDLENIVVKVDDKILEKDKDYLIVKTIEENQIKITIKFIGDYANLKDVVKLLEIVNEENKANVVISPLEKESDLENIVVKVDDKILEKDKDYMILKTIEENQIKITIKFIGDYANLEEIVKIIPVEKGDSIDTSDKTNLILYVMMLILSLGILLIYKKIETE